jgi:hypothetical protein
MLAFGLEGRMAMRRLLVLSLLGLACPALAEEAKKPEPPVCREARDSADYVPGVDARGRPVAPADLPGGVDVEISTEVFANVRTRNRQLNGVGVDVRLKGLETPLCPPAPPPPPPVKQGR